MPVAHAEIDAAAGPAPAWELRHEACYGAMRGTLAMWWALGFACRGSCTVASFARVTGQHLLTAAPLRAARPCRLVTMRTAERHSPADTQL